MGRAVNFPNRNGMCVHTTTGLQGSYRRKNVWTRNMLSEPNPPKIGGLFGRASRAWASSGFRAPRPQLRNFARARANFS